MYRKTALFIVLILSAAGCVIMGKHLFEVLSEYKTGEDIYEEISSVAHKEMTDVSGSSSDLVITETISVSEAITETEPVMEYSSPVDFDVLLEISSDVRGWIRLEGTKVDYPVMQSTDNDYYLNRAVNGVWNKAGTPFIDFRNSGDFSDPLTVIYGHYMGNGSMFTDIHKYKSQQFYDEHPYIELYTPDTAHRILPVAGVYQNAEYWDFTFDYGSDEAFLRQIDVWKALSTFKSETEYDSGDRFVVLTLCTYDIENGRFLLIGKLSPFVLLEEQEEK